MVKDYNKVNGQESGTRIILTKLQLALGNHYRYVADNHYRSSIYSTRIRISRAGVDYVFTVLLVNWFRSTGESGEKSERFLDLSWDWWWCGQMSSVRLVTVFISNVAGLDGLAVWGYVSHCSLEYCYGSFRAWFQVADLFLSDSVIGLETAIRTP